VAPELDIPILEAVSDLDLLRQAGDALSRDDPGRCFALLQTELPDRLAQADGDADEVNRLCLQIVHLAILNCRDKGRWRDAVGILEAIGRFPGVYLQTQIELMLIHIYWARDYATVLSRLKTYPDPIRHDHRMILLEATCYCEMREFNSVMYAVRRLPPGVVAQSPFDNIWSDINFATCWHLLELSEVIRSRQMCSNWDVADKCDDMSWMFSGLINPDMSNFAFYIQISRTAFNHGFQVRDSGWMMADFLLTHLDRLNDSKKVTVFFMIVCLNDHDLFDRFLRHDPDLDLVTRLARYPTFVKAMDLYCQRSGRARYWLKICLSLFFGSGECRSSMAGDASAYDFSDIRYDATCAMEICARYPEQVQYAVPTACRVFLPRSAQRPAMDGAAPKHLFIGFFGQCRFPYQTLPQLLAYIRKDLEPWLAAGHQVSYGISTWTETGQHKLEPDSYSHQFLERLPRELQTLVHNQRFNMFRELADMLPATTAKLVALSTRNAQIDTHVLRDLFGFDVTADIKEDSAYRTELGAMIAQEYGSHARDFMNQGRMWDRPHGLGEVFRAVEQQTGQAVDQMIAMRTDMVFSSGSLAALVDQIATDPHENMVICNNNQTVNYMDGIDDCYWVGHTRAASRVFDGKAMLEAMLTNPDLRHHYRDRLHPHRLARSLYFEHGCDMKVASDAMHFYLFRGSFTLSDLWDEIRLDATTSPNENGRVFAQRLLA
jgi:hypothetical protein